MSTQITEWLEVIAKILLLCWLFGFVLLFIWLGAFMSGAVYKLHGPLMDLSAHELDVIHYCGIEATERHMREEGENLKRAVEGSKGIACEEH